MREAGTTKCVYCKHTHYSEFLPLQKSPEKVTYFQPPVKKEPTEEMKTLTDLRTELASLASRAAESE